MAIKRKKFSKGIRVKPNAEALAAEGEITVDSADNKLKARLDSSDRSVVTEDQSQTVTNKTIDADNNTISNIETDNLKSGVLVTDVSTATSDTELPSALAVKTALEGQNEASEISHSNGSNEYILGADVQAALDAADAQLVAADAYSDAISTALGDHISGDPTGHPASDITNTPSGNLAATDVQGALNELQTEIDGIPTDSSETPYTPNGTKTIDGASTNAQAAIDDLDDETDSTRTLTGTAKGAEDLGTFSGSTIPPTTTVKAGMQSLETAHESHTGATTAHGILGDVLGTTDSQTISYKVIDSTNVIQTPAIVLPTRLDVKKDTFANLTTYAATADDGQLAFATDLDKYYTITNFTLEEIGSGSGSGGSSGINYLTGDDSNAEGSVGNWTGDTNVAVSRVANDSLRDTAYIYVFKSGGGDASGQTAQVPFTIDKADLSTKLTISFDQLETSLVQDGDFRVEIVKDPNGTPETIRVNGEDIKAGAGKHYAQFQTDHTIQEYELVIKVISTTTSDIGLGLDNVQVGPTNLAFGTIVTDWKSDTPSIKGTTADPTLGTTSINTIEYRRVGDSMQCNVSVYQSAAGTNGTGGFYVEIPGNLNIDDSKYPVSSSSTPRKVLGSCAITVNGTRYEGSVIIQESGGSAIGVSCYIFNDTSGLGGWNAGSHSFSLGTYDIQMDFTVPIQGWSSNTQMSEDLGGRDVYFEGRGGSGSPTASTQGITFTSVTDTTASWDGNTFTCPETGEYLISGHALATATITTWNIQAYIDGTAEQVLGRTESSTQNHFSGVVSLQKGQELELRSGDTFTISNNTDFHWVRIQKLASPQTILETETVAARASTSSTSITSGSDVTVVFSSVSGDTHAAYNNSTGVYTAPVPGWYDTKSHVEYNSTSWSAGNTVRLGLKLNGSIHSYLEDNIVQSSYTSNLSINGTDLVYLNKGDTVEITAFQNTGGAVALTNNSQRQYFSIHRVK